ncbi:aldehyde dehydrogenase 3, member A2 [Entomortierella beljakovae]|nr:aldehyde dehydrogenase 3, member A2 [Entomortierella beljakovae]
MTFGNTPIESIPKIVANARSFFRSHKTQSLEYRKEQLRALQRLASENQNEIVAAVKADLAWDPQFEVPSIIATCEKFINNLETLTENQKAVGQGPKDDCYVKLSPLGTVLIIGAWNLPFGLILEPLAGAIAAGNVAVIKPSENSENSAREMTRLVKKYLDPQLVYVVNGGVEETTVVLQQRFDHIFYTGNNTVAKVIMEAAAKHLTPVTLELGGKCPVILTEDTDPLFAGQKIAGWKTLNCGQICVTADYVLCPTKIRDQLIENIVATWKGIYGEDMSSSKGYSRIINKRQHDRLEKVLEAARAENTIAFGGRTIPSDLYIEPTIVTDVKPTDTIMQSEIFGPILAIITCDDFDHALEIVNEQESPLSLYLFSEKKELVDRDDALPFGGVGASGMGSYHGKYSIDTFSHKRSVLVKPQSN